MKYLLTILMLVIFLPGNTQSYRVEFRVQLSGNVPDPIGDSYNQVLMHNGFESIDLLSLNDGQGTITVSGKPTQFTYSINTSGCFAPSMTNGGESLGTTNLYCFTYSESFSLCSTIRLHVFIKYEPLLNNLNGPSDNSHFCENQTVSLRTGYPALVVKWEYKVGSGAFRSLSSSTTANSVNLTMRNIFGSGYTAYFGQPIFFRYTLNNCNGIIYSPTRGPYVFYPEPPAISESNTLMPVCKGGTDGIIRVTGLNRTLRSGETVTYSVFTLNNNIVAQISSNSQPSINSPINILGSSQSSFGIPAGEYKIRVKSSLSECGNPDDYHYETVHEPDSVTVDFLSSPITCYSGSNGTLTLTASGGSGTGYQYSKDGGATFQVSNVFTGLIQGIYSIKAKDGNSCPSGIAPVHITQPPELLVSSASITSDYNEHDISCYGLSDGAITVVATGGSGVLQYSRNGTDFQPANVLSNLKADSYTITIKDANNCRRLTNPILVTQPSQIVISNINASPICFGQTGTITVSATGGAGAFQFSKNNDLFSENILYPGPAGIYEFKAKDRNGCAVSKNIELIQPPAISLSPVATLIDCPGGNNGTITITASNGITPYQYSMTGGSLTGAFQSSNKYNGLVEANYSIVVKDINNCLGTANVLLKANPPIVGIISVQNPISCNGGNNGVLNLSSSGGVGPYTYSWNNGPTTEDINELTTGEYKVMIKDSNNCSKEVSHNLTQPLPITINHIPSDYNGFNIRCFNQNNGSINITTSGGNGGYSYRWSNGATTEDVVSLTAGTYTVNVLDSKSCPGVQQIILTQPDLLTSNQTLKNILCFGANTGAITFAPAGGTPGYEFSVNNGSSWQSSPVVDNLAAGNYRLLTRDKNNCQVAASRELISPENIILSVSNIVNTTCGQSNGSALASATGGVADYLFEWFNSSGTRISNTASNTNLAADIYRVLITDQNSCTKQQNVLINTSNGPQVTPGLIRATTCSDSADGVGTIAITGGATPYSILWPDGQTTVTASGLAGGQYIVQVKDRDNCIAFEQVEIPAPEDLIINTLIKKDPKCNGDNNGEIKIEPVGGNGSYTYNWNTGATTPDLTNLPAGTYDILVKDFKDCSHQEQIVLSDPPMLVVDLGPDQKICEGMNVVLSAEESNAIYNWTSVNGFTSTSQTVQLNTADIYTLTVINGNGCEASDVFELTYDSQLLKADFLMASEAHVGDTVMVIDISWPLPEQTIWSYTAGTMVMEETRDYTVVRYDQPGDYTIGLLAKLAGCSNNYDQGILILEAEEKIPALKTNQNLITKVSAFPNPSPDEVSVAVELSEGREVLLEVHQAETSKQVFREILTSTAKQTKRLNLSVFPRGVYFISIKAGKETRVLKIVKQ